MYYYCFFLNKKTYTCKNIIIINHPDTSQLGNIRNILSVTNIYLNEGIYITKHLVIDIFRIILYFSTSFLCWLHCVPIFNS